MIKTAELPITYFKVTQLNNNNKNSNFILHQVLVHSYKYFLQLINNKKETVIQILYAYVKKMYAVKIKK